MSGRERILARVARATEGRGGMPHPGARPIPLVAGMRADSWALGDAEKLGAFADRFERSGGEVVLPEEGAQPSEWLTWWLRKSDPPVRGVVVGHGVPDELRPRLPVVAPAHAGAGVSMAWGAVAETGSLILPASDTRAVQLLPPAHVVWVKRVFGRLEEALSELRADGAGKGLGAAVGLHSAPSKSADIGRTVVTGVHGPGRCVAVVLGVWEGN